MRKRLLAGCSTLLLAVFAMGSTPASACDDDCGCGYGYGYGGYAYSYYAAPVYAYYARPAYAYYVRPEYRPNVYYSSYAYRPRWGYGPSANYRVRHAGRRHW